MTQELPAARAEHSRVREHDGAHLFHALIDVEEDDEEHQRDAQRHLGEDAQPEPHRENRREDHPRHRVRRLDVGLEQSGCGGRKRQPEAHHQTERGVEAEGKHGLDQRDAEMPVDLAGGEPARRVSQHRHRSPEEEPRKHAGLREHVPDEEDPPEEQDAAEEQPDPMRAGSAHGPSAPPP